LLRRNANARGIGIVLRSADLDRATRQINHGKSLGALLKQPDVNPLHPVFPNSL